VSGRADIFILLSSENIDGNQVDLSVAVLSGLGGGHFHNLAREALDADKSSLTQSRALHRIDEGGSGADLNATKEGVGVVSNGL